MRKHARWVFNAALVFNDLAGSALAFYAAYQMRAQLSWPYPSQNIGEFEKYLPMMAILLGWVGVIFFFHRLYHLGRATSRLDEILRVAWTFSLAMIFTIATVSLVFKDTLLAFNYPRAMVLYAWILGIWMISIGRIFLRFLWGILRARGWDRSRVLIVGTGEAAEAVIHRIQDAPWLGYEIIGVVAPNGTNATQIAGIAIIGTASDLPDLVYTRDVDEVLIAIPEAPHSEVLRLISLCERGNLSIKIYPDIFQLITTHPSLDDLGGLPLLTVRDVAQRGWKLMLKRAMDIVGASIAMILLSPLMLLIAILIKLDSPGPVFYVQERMGLDGRPFLMLKFRSMRADAEKDGPGWTRPGDPRRTRVGRILRQLNLDELPQLINVLLGDMSLVGPRPERPIYVEQFRQVIPRYMERHREKAGITGWAQINGLRGDTSITERTKYDLWYVENWSIWLDVKILLRTIVQTMTFRSPNAY
ncbi:MAG: undecaprenyl-phosphate glucose phosphotransferase [Anaerolineae bacterium]|nr:undecaprenyl-phosphate glucose phosphotransferase [Thermoflexus sp.]MDW8065128.1 undecaprenyl-phosphate glucose phosphotransferase [Anaerolineae bacterium]